MTDAELFMKMRAAFREAEAFVEAAADRIEAQAAEIDSLRDTLAHAKWLLVDASVQLEEGPIKTRRNRALLIQEFLTELKGAKP